MPNQQLHQAQDLIVAGKNKQAIQILNKLLDQDSRNEAAWLLAVEAFDSKSAKVKILEKALNFLPNSSPISGRLTSIKMGEKSEIKSGNTFKKWLIPLGIACTSVIVGVIVCAVVASLGFFRLAQTLPTPAPTLVLTVGKGYWVNALIPPQGLLAGLVLRNADVYNKPGNPITDPSVTIIAVIPDATELTLKAVQANWCYVEGTYYPFRELGITDYSQSIEGWMECNRLLDYAPTPYPTPDKTPQAP